jgi:hypothetical protein
MSEVTQYYWLFVTKDGVQKKVPPAMVPTVQKKMAKKEPVQFRDMTVPFSEIQSFRATSEPYATQKQLEESAHQVFNEPMEAQVDSGYGYTETVIKARFVKKQVTNDVWHRHYSKIPAYMRLGDDGIMTTMAFMLPIHQIDGKEVQYCTKDEINQLTR